MIQCTIEKADGTSTEFAVGVEASGESLSIIAARYGVDIPVSCGAGACFVCAVKIVEGKEYMCANVCGEPLIDLTDDELLTCIGGFNSEALTDDVKHTVRLRMM